MLISIITVVLNREATVEDTLRSVLAQTYPCLLYTSNVGGIAWSIGCINSGNVPLILNAHIEKEHLHNLLDIYRPSYVCCLLYTSVSLI